MVKELSNKNYWDDLDSNNQDKLKVIFHHVLLISISAILWPNYPKLDHNDANNILYQLTLNMYVKVTSKKIVEYQLSHTGFKQTIPNMTHNLWLSLLCVVDLITSA